MTDTSRQCCKRVHFATLNENSIKNPVADFKFFEGIRYLCAVPLEITLGSAVKLGLLEAMELFILQATTEQAISIKQECSVCNVSECKDIDIHT